MRYSSIGRILGVLLMLFSATHLPPLLVDLHYAEQAWQPFALSFLVTLLTGFALWWPYRTRKQELRIRDGYLVTVLFWIVLGSFGALPFAL